MPRIMPLLAMALLVAGCGWRDGGHGASGSRDFVLDGFDQVSASGPVDVEIRVGRPFHVRADGPSDALDRLSLRVAGGKLAIGNRPGSFLLSMFGHRSARVHVRVDMPAIRVANLNGAGDIGIDRVTGDRFEGAIAGAGHVRIAALQTGSARLALAGAGGFEVAGEARRLEVAMNGAGNVDAAGLTAGDIQLSISGVGNLKARATGKVTGQMSGVGNVEIAGTRDCDIRRAGVGTVKCGA